jgi:hypothetical protein
VYDTSTVFATPPPPVVVSHGEVIAVLGDGAHMTGLGEGV